MRFFLSGEGFHRKVNFVETVFAYDHHPSRGGPGLCGAVASAAARSRTGKNTIRDWPKHKNNRLP